MPSPDRLARPLALTIGALPGAALAVGALAAGALRRDKALHPKGHIGEGRLLVTDPDATLGPPVLALEGVRACELRWSRAMGLPTSWPDIEGMAMRLPGAGDDGGVADLLFASTGTHTWSRYLLTLRASGCFGVLTTLLPVRAAGGPLTFRLVPGTGSSGLLPPSSYSLEVARGAGAWRRVGTVAAEWSDADTPERFDPVTHRLAGVEQYPVVAAMREPAYVAARAVAEPGGWRRMLLRRRATAGPIS